MIEYRESDQIPGFEGGADASTYVKVIGLGGAGANVLDRMALEGCDDADLLTLSTDVRALSTSVSGNKIQLGAALLKGIGTGGDPSLGKQAALEAVDEIRDAVRGRGIVFLCVGLGGGTGSGAAPEVARIIREEGAFLFVFATMPFSFEGQRRVEQAKEALRAVGRYANAVITFENDRMGELIVPRDGVAAAFAAADKVISQSVRAIMNVVFRPGIIRIGLDDLLTALHSKHSVCLFGYGVAKGDNRCHEAVEHALKCPLLDRGKLLNESKAVLVQVAGGETMTLFEVQLVMEEVAKYVGNQTQILFGTGTDKRLGNSLSVTIISAIADVAAEATYDEPLAVSRPAAPTPVSLGMAPPALESPRLLTPTSPRLSAAQEESHPAQAAHDHHQISLPEDEDAAVYETLDESDGYYSDEPASVVPFNQPERGAAVAAQSPPPLTDLEEEEVNPIAFAVEGRMREPDTRRPAVRPLSAPPLDESGEIIRPTGRTAVDRVEAVTDASQKIVLSRRLSSGNTGRIKTRDPLSEVDGPVLPPTKAPSAVREEIPAAPSRDVQQQQELLQLEPVASKGRFAKSDPTIIDGEDLDVPTFLRKSK
jgi:cell division protein FtsZ